MNSSVLNRREEEGKPSLGKLVEESGIQKLLKLEQLESSCVSKN